MKHNDIQTLHYEPGEYVSVIQYFGPTQTLTPGDLFYLYKYEDGYEFRNTLIENKTI